MTTSERPRVVAIDDDRDTLFLLETLLTDAGFSAVTAEGGEEGLRRAREEAPDIILTDLQMPKVSGLDVVSSLRADESFRFVPITVLTASEDDALLTSAFERGANDFIRKPFSAPELLARLRGALRTRDLYRALEREEHARVSLLTNWNPASGIVGSSPQMQEVLRIITQVKDAAVPVLIQGETGTGKELIARALHSLSNRKRAPFIAQNCSAFSEQLLESELFGYVRGAFTGAQRDKEGLFAAADGGVLFLDEIGELKLPLQAKLLRVLQEGTFIPVGATRERKVDVRVIAATHRDLRAMVRDGTFREDLLYRINVITVELPPLRERREDIPAIVSQLLARHAPADTAVTIAPETFATLTRYPFPGNIRELENEIRRALLLMGERSELLPADLSPLVRAGSGEVSSDTGGTNDGIPTLAAAFARVERDLIAQALAATGGNKSEAARRLGISRSHIIQKTQEYGLSREGKE